MNSPGAEGASLRAFRRVRYVNDPHMVLPVRPDRPYKDFC